MKVPHSPKKLSIVSRLLLAAPLLCSMLLGSPKLYMAGDSTMADKSTTPPNLERGWGQMLRPYLVDAGALVNFAANGRSTKSFISEGRWQKLLEALQPGDFVIVQFGHNDEKEKSPDRYAPARGLYRQNLMRFVSEVREKGATPILATSLCRRKFDEKGRVVDTHGAYTEVVRELAAEEKVALLDLHVATWQLLSRLGPDSSKELFMWVAPGKYPELPKGKQDDTHLNEKGGLVVAKLAVDEMCAKRMPVAALFRDRTDPEDYNGSNSEKSPSKPVEP